MEIRGLEAVATLVAAGELGKVLVMKWVPTESIRSNNGGPPHPSVLWAVRGRAELIAGIRGGRLLHPELCLLLFRAPP